MAVRGVRRIFHFACAGGVVVALLTLATPAAAFDPDYKGWFAALDLAQTQPAGLDQHFANRLTGTNPTSVERVVIDNGMPTVWRADLGYGFGKGLGSLQVAYWSYDHDDAQRANPEGGVLYPTIFGSGQQGNLGGQRDGSGDPVPLDASSSVKAKTLDLDYVRPMMYGDKFTIRWLAGLRHATFEEDRAVVAIGSAYTAFQSKHIDSQGTGIRFGLTAHFIFSAHFALDGSLAFSSLRSKTDADATQIIGTFTDNLNTHDGSVSARMADVDLRAVWSYGRLDYYLGYGTSNWDGLVADPLAGPNGTNSGPSSTPADRARNSLAFDSVHAGILWRFGKD